MNTTFLFQIKKFRVFLITSAMSLAMLCAALITPLGVFAQASESTPTDFKSLVGLATGLINKTIPVIITLGLLYFIWGLVRYVSAGGDAEKMKEARNFILSGVIALFVIVSIWGLVKIVVNSFFPGTYGIPQIK